VVDDAGVPGVGITGEVVGIDVSQIVEFRQRLTLLPLHVVGKALTDATGAAAGGLRTVQVGSLREGIERCPKAHGPKPTQSGGSKLKEPTSAGIETGTLSCAAL
jgi:hypothetical protein